VDESEWLRGTDPRPMLKFLRGRASDRKRRLFGVACCRTVWDLLTDERSRKAVEVMERYVDGQATEGEWGAARSAIEEQLDTPRHPRDSVLPVTRIETTEAATLASRASWVLTLRGAETSISWVSVIVGWTKAKALGFSRQDLNNMAFRDAMSRERSIQTDLLRDIFGPLLFRPVTVDPSWLEWNGGTVLHLAQSIYEARRFGDLPILADALEDSGCSDLDILGHLRSPGPHVRGCWVVDLVLGKW
jgi:hypothetical protein